jgi:membrane-bound lytic murein transglycosylase A
MPAHSHAIATLVLVLAALSGCVQMPGKSGSANENREPAKTTSACPVCAGIESAKPAEKPLQAAEWRDLTGWGEDQLGSALVALTASCRNLGDQAIWSQVCREATEIQGQDNRALQIWFETRFKPWALTQPDGSRNGLVTGYYEPLIKGSRTSSNHYAHPVFAPPDDLITVDLAELFPELKHLRLRGRIEGRKLIPYYSRAEWTPQEATRTQGALAWVNDPLDLFFMQIQGSGQIQLPDGSRIRLNYADQNGHPYRSIGKWLIDQGYLKADQASMQGIKAWAKANPARMTEMLNANPSMVFFRELSAQGSGPQGAMGISLTPERSIAIDPRHITLGAPVWLATTRPNSDQPLNRLMVAQDTGGAIRGVVRADFYWGSGNDAGSLAGRMKQQGRMWVFMPRAFVPN